MRFVLLDANLLVLLVVGAVDQGWIARHKRVRRFAANDWKLLRRLIDGPQLVTTPHILAEASNLLRSGGLSAAAHEKLMVGLGVVIAAASEEHVPGKGLVDAALYRRLGLTDAGILSLLRPHTYLLTDDDELWREAIKLGWLASSFDHLRNGASRGSQ